jgi:hypothetical protein
MNLLEHAEELKKRFEEEQEWYKKRGWFSLYKTDYRKEGYKDQFGIWHWANVLVAEIKVRYKSAFIAESWGCTMQGIIAEDIDGNEYQRYPDAIARDQTWSGNGFYNLTTYLHGLTVREDGTLVKEPEDK